MAEPSMTRAGQPRRSTRISQELQAARRRNAEQQAARKAQDKLVDDALKAFFTAGKEITKADTVCAEKVAVEERKMERKIEPQRRRIEDLRAQRRDRVAAQEATQARAAWTIHVADRTVEQVAGLLEVSQHEARRLIAAGRRTATSASDDETTEPAAQVSASEAVSGKQAELSGVDGQEDAADMSFVPAAPDGSGQGA